MVVKSELCMGICCYHQCVFQTMLLNQMTSLIIGLIKHAGLLNRYRMQKHHKHVFKATEHSAESSEFNSEFSDAFVFKYIHNSVKKHKFDSQFLDRPDKSSAIPSATSQEMSNRGIKKVNSLRTNPIWRKLLNLTYLWYFLLFYDLYIFAFL